MCSLWSAEFWTSCGKLAVLIVSLRISFVCCFLWLQNLACHVRKVITLTKVLSSVTLMMALLAESKGYKIVGGI